MGFNIKKYKKGTSFKRLTIYVNKKLILMYDPATFQKRRRELGRQLKSDPNHMLLCVSCGQAFQVQDQNTAAIALLFGVCLNCYKHAMHHDIQQEFIEDGELFFHGGVICEDYVLGNISKY